MKLVCRLAMIAVLCAAVVTPACTAVYTYFSEDFESYSVPVGMRVASPSGPGWIDNWGAPADIFVTSTSDLTTKALDGKSMTTTTLGEIKDLRGIVPSGVGISELKYDAFVEGFGLGQGTSQCSFGFGDMPSYIPQLWWEYTGNGTGWVLREWISTTGIVDYPVGMIGSSEAVTLTLSIDFVNKKFKGSLAWKSDGFLLYETSWIPYTQAATGNALYMRQQYWNGDTISGMSIDNITLTNTEPIPAQLGTLTGKVILGGYTSGDTGLAPVRIELKQGGTVVRTEQPYLDANSKFTITNVTAGDYDVVFSACKWLKKVVTGVTVPSGGTKTMDDLTLQNGDVDGDNQITSSDLSILLTNLGSVGQ
jgi:hypothetical protein